MFPPSMMRLSSFLARTSRWALLPVAAHLRLLCVAIPEDQAMLWVNLAAAVTSWSGWLWQHRQTFDPVLQRLGPAGDFAQAALSNPGGALRRVGNTLIFGQADAGPKVL